MSCLKHEIKKSTGLYVSMQTVDEAYEKDWGLGSAGSVREVELSGLTLLYCLASGFMPQRLS